MRELRNLLKNLGAIQRDIAYAKQQLEYLDRRYSETFPDTSRHINSIAIRGLQNCLDLVGDPQEDD